MGPRSKRSDPTPAFLSARARARLEAGDAAGAVELLVQAIGQRRDLAPIWSALGEALEPLGRWTEAALAYEQAARLASHDPAVHRDRGRALLKCRRLEEARRALRRAAALDPGSAQVQELLGLTLHATGRRAEARRAYERALALEPGRASAHHHLGLLHSERGESTPALEHLRAATEAQPKCGPYQRDLARVALRARDVELARRAATSALELAPADALGHIVMAWTCQAQGRSQEAIARYRHGMALDPGQTSPYYELARAGEFDDLQAIARQLERPARTPHERSELHFARAEVLRRRGDHDGAWRACCQGRAETAAEVEYDPAEHRRMVERIVRCTPRELFTTRAGMGDPGPLPVFVVGMPHSGTSLAERILAAHPLVHAIGEHGGARDLAGALRRHIELPTDHPEGLRQLEGQGALRLAAAYLGSFGRPQREFERVVDRTPENFHYLGLLALVLRGARVIHVRRDPRDTCVAHWFTPFGKRRCAYACDLEHLAAYHEDYQRLMAHWRVVLPLPMLEVDHEELVADPEGASRRLFGFLELPCDERAADSLPAVAPAVSRGANGPSFGRWRLYERHLGPLLRLVPAGSQAAASSGAISGEADGSAGAGTPSAS